MKISKLFISCCAATAFLFNNSASAEELATVFYAPSDEIITNPERGMFSHHEFFSDKPDELDLDYLDAERAEGRSLIFTVYVMRDFRNKEISKPYLNKIMRNLRSIRRAGMKAVVRFCYSYSEADKPWDAPWEITQRHIEQLAPILQEYSDVIAVLEAGFVGVWGEWYYTDNYNYQPEPHQYGPRKQVLEKLLETMPGDRFVSVRYPIAKLHTYNLNYTDTISSQTAHDGSHFSRIGFHNDCFLASSDDVGTFNDVPEYRQYWLWDSRYVPMGGETCGVSDFCEVPNALKDFSGYHWSYLNKDYHLDVLEKWERENFMPEVLKKLGYRFALKQGRFSKDPVAGGNMHVELEIANEGWAAPFNPRDVELVFVKKKGGNKYSVKLPDDPRKWLSEATHKVVADITLPADMPTGEYDLFLNLPDPRETLHNKPEYSIRLANDKVWKKKNGYNQLHTIEIKQGSGLQAATVADALTLTALKK